MVWVIAKKIIMPNSVLFILITDVGWLVMKLFVTLCFKLIQILLYVYVLRFT